VSAGGVLQSAIAGALGGVEDFTGIFDGPPARASYPYAVIDAGNETDWSHKSGEGREVLVGVTVWDDQPVRLHQLADAIEATLGSLGALAGWELVTIRLVRRRIVRDVAGPWAAAVDFRARMLATS
jgi:hypothetical protein